VAKKKASAAAKKGNRIIRYFREARAEVSKIVWPTQQATINLTLIVLGVTTAMSIGLGVIDWVFSRLFALIIA